MNEKKIREYKDEDYLSVSSIWLDTNIKAHYFIDKNYWIENQDVFKEGIEGAKLFVFDDNDIKGFIGLLNNYIAGIFVMDKYQGRGIGKFLLNHAKKEYDELSLDVYEKNKRAVKFYLENGFKINKKYIEEETNEKSFRMTWKRGD